MDFMQFIGGLKGEFLKQRLLQAGISPNDIQGIDFNNINDLNLLAEKIAPKLIRANPNIANLIKQNSTILGKDKQKEVVEVIDAM